MDTVESLYSLDELMNFIQPRYVAVKLSDEQYSKKYETYARSAAFKTDMKKLDFLIKTKNDEEIKGFRGWDLKDLHNFYLFDYCNRKKCAVMMGDIDEDKIAKKQLAKLKLVQLKKEMSEGLSEIVDREEIDVDTSIETIRNEYYVELMMDKISPRYSVMPQPLNKTLVGVAGPGDIEEIGKIWRNKFKSVYRHEILDAADDSDEEKSEEVILKQNERFKY